MMTIRLETWTKKVYRCETIGVTLRVLIGITRAGEAYKEAS